MHVTIYDIAEKTGFSAPSVSKVLNGKGTLSKRNIEYILQTAKDLGYKPNLAARSLITKKSKLIGVIFTDPYSTNDYSHPVYTQIINIVRKELAKKGYDIIYLSANFGGSHLSYADHCNLRNVDAVLLATTDCTLDDLEQISKLEIPRISLNDIYPNINAIVCDNVKAGYDAATCFIENGHTHMAYLDVIFDSGKSPDSHERKEGFIKALKDNNIKDIYIQECKFWDEKSGYDAVKELLENNKNISAIFTSSDRIAMGVLEYFKEVNIKVPDDISLIGFDDDLISSLLNPPLASFKHDIHAFAEKVLEVLLNALDKKENEDLIRIPANLIIRESVKRRWNYEY